jgi:hypothetical protein
MLVQSSSEALLRANLIETSYCVSGAVVLAVATVTVSLPSW